MRKLWKKALSMMLSLAMVASCFSGFSAKVQAEESNEIGKVTATVDGNKVVIGNEYISREFSIAGDKLETVNITNKRTDNGATVFTPAEGSEEFIIKTVKVADPGLSKTGWTATADSWQGTDSDGDPSKAIDGNIGTLWHSGYNDSAGINKSGMPMNFVINLGKETEFGAFGYTGRGNGNNGRINGYEIYLYNGTGATLGFDDAAWGTAVKSGNFANGTDEQYVEFGGKVKATQIRIKITSSYGEGNQANQFGSAAEFSLYEKAPNAGSAADNIFAASDLELAKTTVEETEATINKIDKVGQKVTFEFAPYTYNDVEYTIKEVVVMYDGDSFMRKHLEISVPDDQASKAMIEYIDLENMDIAASYLADGTYWTIPEQSNNPDMANMKGDYLELGQPYYLAAMYWGCEFPQTENKIREENAFIRYHYGKTLAKDAHFEYNKNNTAGEMVTWDAVVGAARSTDYSVVQADFYEYIETIATDTDFRQQYNSWYDNMKNITKENLETSFFEIEKGFTQNGINPLDSYVADDGWMNYNSFWDFDESKFPNELYDASLQAEQMGSRFGLWVGPRGGYGTQTTIANWIARNGLGSVNPQSGNDINISDARYLNKLRDDIFIGYQNKFGVNYWKLDGMLLEPSKVASEYYTTYNAFATISETYERWTDVYEDMRAAKTDGDLWINMTSYSNPSPWHVQWVNSVWMQNTGDTGYNNSFGASDQEAMLTYRDNSYYNFLKERQWQLPHKYFYNHDPVYGLTANDAYSRPDIYFTTEELRDHLYMLGTRGTAFWEYYYSYSMFDEEKWDVNAEAARWIEDNFDILQKSQMIGGKPANGDVYGFSCWNGSDGIVSLRNPKNVEQTYTLTFDRLIGVAEDTENVFGKVIVGDISYQNDDAISYGDSIQITLPAKEVLIVQYGAKDTTAAAIDSVHATAATTVEVEFDEAIREPEAANFTVEGNTVTAVSLKADLRTAVLTLGEELEDAAAFTVNVSGVKDTVGNVTTASAANEFYQNESVVVVEDATFDGSAALTKEAAVSVDGKEGFTVIGKFSTASENATILEQKGAYKVSIKDGYLVFELNNGLTVQSKYTAKTVNRSTGVVTSEDHGIIADGEVHAFAAVKEINGMIKLYIDGKLVASAYDEAKVNPVLAKGELVFGEGLTADVEFIEVLDKAMAFDEVADYVVLPEGPSESSEAIPSTSMTVEASSTDTSEANINKEPRNAIDGDTSTFWATAPGGTLADASYVITLDDVYTINQVDYTKRYDSSAGWDCTGNLFDITISVSTDGEDWAEVATVDTVDGTTEITFDAVEAKYVKVTATESYHWDTPDKDGEDDLRNTVMTIAELAVYKAPEEPFTTYTEKVPFVLPDEANETATLEAEHMIINNSGTGEQWPMQVTEKDWASNGKILNAMNNGDSATLYYNAPVAGTYTATLTYRSGAAGNGFSWSEANGKITAGNVTAGATDSASANHTATFTLEVVEAGAGVLTLTAASAGAPQMDKFDIVLTETPDKPVNKEALTATIAAVEASADEADKYTDESVAALMAALNAAKTVAEDEDATQDEVNAAVEALNAAIAGLKEKPVAAADKTALKAVIDSVELLDKHYTEESWNALGEAVAGATRVYEASNATQDEVDAAAATLQEIIDGLDFAVCHKFADVEHDSWYEDSVQYVYDEEIIIGDGNLFAPNRATSRFMIAVILYRLAGSPEVTDYTEYKKFKDLPAVEDGIWYTDAVAWALEEGVSTGDDYNWLYNPDASVTREQLALFLWRYTKYVGEDVTVTKTEEELFGDTFVNEWAKEGFGWAVDREIIKGAEEKDSNGNVYYVLNPQGAAARAQVAVMFHRYLGGATE